MSNVLVINPTNIPFSPEFFRIEPIDMLNIASYIQKAGHTVKIIDMDADHLQPEDLLSSEIEAYDFALFIYDYHIPLHTDKSFDALMQSAAILKKMKMTVAVCGKIATFRPELFIHENSPVDVALKYDAEDTVLEILKKGIDEAVDSIAFLKDKKCTETKRREKFDVNKLPVPDYGLVDLSKYIDVRTILSSRGCSNKCAFCHVPNFWGNWRGRDAQKVVAEIENLVLNYKAQKIMFLDDNAMVSKKRMEEICHLLIEKKLSVRLGCLGSLSFFDEGLYRLMYKAGFRWIHYGAESGSNRLLKENGKHQTREEIISVIEKTKALGFRVRSSWIIDLPGSTLEEIKQTIDTIKHLQTHEIRIHYLALRLGTKIFDQRKEKEFTQYIHRNCPLPMKDNPNPKIIEKRVDDMIKGLEHEGYIALKSLKDYENIPAERVNDANVNVVSLCPLRYGMGWQA